MSAQDALLTRFLDMLSVQPATIDRTILFKDASHEELCRAFHYWFSQIQLLLGQPVQIVVTQGPQDEGADLVADFPTVSRRFGIQIKSDGDVKNADFRQKLMSQITYSHKHNLSKLFVAICSNMTDNTQLMKTRNALSQLSQVGDYAIPVPPERAVVVLECYRAKKHPLSYIRGTKEIARALEGLGRALSDDTYVAEIKVNLESREKFAIEDDSARGKISFKPGESALDGLDLIRIARAGQPVLIPGDWIDHLTFLDKDGNPLIPEGGKVEWIKLIPNIAKMPPVNLVTRDFRTGGLVRLDGIHFVRQNVVDDLLYLVSNDEPRPFQLALQLALSKGAANFDAQLDDCLADAKDTLLYAKFMIGLLKSGGFEMRDGVNDSLLLDMHLTNAGPTKDMYDTWLELLENLSFVQDRMKVRIRAPVDPTTWDLQASRKIRELLETGRTQLPFFRFDTVWRKADLSAALNQVREKGAIFKMSVNIGEFKFSICNQLLILRHISAEVPCARPIEDLSSLENRCRSSGDEERIVITLATCENKPATVRLTKDSDGNKD